MSEPVFAATRPGRGWRLPPVLACLCSVGLLAPSASGRATLDEEYEVYRAVLAQRDYGRIVRRESQDRAPSGDFETTAAHLGQAFVDGSSGRPLPDAMIESFRELRASNRDLDVERLPSGVTLVPSEEIDALYGAGGSAGVRDLLERWDDFERRFGSSRITTLSRVAFSEDGERALLGVAMQCGLMCGHGEYLLLGKVDTDGSWRVLKRHGTWIS